MNISKEKFKSLFEWGILIPFGVILGLALADLIVQPYIKTVFLVLLLFMWAGFLGYGFIFKEAYFVNDRLKDIKLVYIFQQAIYLVLIVLSINSLFGNLYT
ncbi:MULTISPECIES: hypothetical protein [Pseudoalteromonas]|uniref:hypothetical protein n=1 Tax=Pseudoalteromonas TaxID=53246 RepID=UPI0012FDFDBA|nr:MULTISPECIES: hypothetical protein [Pseudoalteromonas]MCQ8885930.1 hypothetical protein [Pseudoalteromonas agarivorans]